jgi:UDP-N-acetyl-2-amino-2-deoxyglucuronate dehydrogenase
MMRHRVGIVGLGMAAGPHLAALEALAPRVEVVACFSPSAERRQRFALRYRLPTVERIETIFEDPTIDLVMLLTPPSTHLSLIERAAQAGKHVLLEKPIEVSADRAAAVVGTMQAAGRTLGVMLQHRFRAVSRRLGALLAERALGEILSAGAAVRWWRPPSYFAEPGRGMRARDGGGVLLTQAIHTLDLLLHLAGPVRRVSAFARQSGLRSIDTEDIVAGSVEFANGALGCIDATTVAYPGFAERIEFAGTAGSAVLAAETLEVFLRNGERLHLEGGPSKSGGADPMAFSPDAHKALIGEFLDALEAGREPLSSGASALAVQALIEALLRSAETGRAVNLAE